MTRRSKLILAVVTVWIWLPLLFLAAPVIAVVAVGVGFMLLVTGARRGAPRRRRVSRPMVSVAWARG